MVQVQPKMEPEESIRLPHKPDSPLSYRYVPGQGCFSTSHLLVYLNGLILAQAGWYETIDRLQLRWAGTNNSNRPALLTYDRYGQARSAPDPADELHGGTHDIREVVRDLHALVREVWKAKQQHKKDGAENEAASPSPPLPKLIFVSNSIGCVIARLYAEAYPGTVEALLFLDSNIANSDLVSIFPDPDAEGFDPAVLPKGTTAEDLRHARAAYKQVFHPSVPNPEHLDRKNIAALVPHSDRPPLRGPQGGKGPWITVVGHDWDTFAEEGSRGSLHVPKSLTNAFMNPAWAKYNEGLARLTDEDRARGPIIARSCGHFIQRDNPALVAELTEHLLGRVETGR
ncbi:alpha/beta-hydrolase [Hypoxylon rubiginosum]|uniref:Alpha/beta-hydrolase n=1 Tax=Hypoxylon rubiginosum TaxID=110542 RepID=A0ACB9YJU5_9PEZI|nr:alpha/beta-hydrolase [Hypoxylon rubiginosum]